MLLVQINLIYDMKYLRRFEDIHSNYNVGDYVSYKRYLGLPPLIVKILSKSYKYDEYFVECLDCDVKKITYIVKKYELDDLTDEQMEYVNIYLRSNDYNI